MSPVDRISLGPNSPLRQYLRTERSEKAEGELCDDCVARISGKRGVVNLSQVRASMLTVGVSDRRYRLLGVALMYELKAHDGQLTKSQHEFLLDELEHGALACCGGLEDLRGFIAAVRLEHQTGQPRIREYCHNTIARWAAKGYRRERIPSKRRRRR